MILLAYSTEIQTTACKPLESLRPLAIFGSQLALQLLLVTQPFTHAHTLKGYNLQKYMNDRSFRL